MAKKLGRYPLKHVRDSLASEVGFRCPVTECGSPYLTFHHFDPPWRVEQHFRTDGMIALCRFHADQADVGAFTDDQLRQLKATAAKQIILGKFSWRRQSLIANVGGLYFLNAELPLMVNRKPMVWFTKDGENNLLLNVDLPSPTGLASRAKIAENYWEVPPNVQNLVCPPSGRLIEINYPDGDRLRVEFRQFPNQAELLRTHPGAESLHGVEFPATVATIEERTQRWDFQVTKNGLWAGGSRIVSGANIEMQDCVISGMLLNVGRELLPAPKRFTGRRGLSLEQIAGPGRWIARHDFERCSFVGSAVLAPCAETVFDKCGFEQVSMSAVKVLPAFAARKPVMVAACNFIACEFGRGIRILSDGAQSYE